MILIDSIISSNKNIRYDSFQISVCVMKIVLTTLVWVSTCLNYLLLLQAKALPLKVSLVYINDLFEKYHFFSQIVFSAIIKDRITKLPYSEKLLGYMLYESIVFQIKISPFFHCKLHTRQLFPYSPHRQMESSSIFR